MFSVPLEPGENLGKVCESSWAGENPRLRLEFCTDLLSNSPKRSLRFSSGYEGTANTFYFLDIASERDEPVC